MEAPPFQYVDKRPGPVVRMVVVFLVHDIHYIYGLLTLLFWGMIQDASGNSQQLTLPSD